MQRAGAEPRSIRCGRTVRETSAAGFKAVSDNDVEFVVRKTLPCRIKDCAAFAFLIGMGIFSIYLVNEGGSELARRWDRFEPALYFLIFIVVVLFGREGFGFLSEIRFKENLVEIKDRLPFLTIRNSDIVSVSTWKEDAKDISNNKVLDLLYINYKAEGKISEIKIYPYKYDETIQSIMSKFSYIPDR